MRLIHYILLSFYILLLAGCSASYKQLSKMEEITPSNFKEYLLSEYKEKATFEAEMMHDWNSAKLYSEKAIKSIKTEDILPEKISRWNLPNEKVSEIKIGYENLILIYDKAKLIDPQNLAKAISSLDCWAEQQEENWQTWDIEKCKEDFLSAMHNIYEKLSANKSNNINSDTEINKTEDLKIITKNKNNDLIQIIYFDFDKFNLSSLGIKKLKLFLKKYKGEINEYLVVGHTDTKGTKKYNISLSIKRAEMVKKLLIEYGINSSQIKIMGKGEQNLAIMTPDDTKQPANRRVEIKKMN